MLIVPISLFSYHRRNCKSLSWQLCPLVCFGGRCDHDGVNRLCQLLQLIQEQFLLRPYQSNNHSFTHFLQKPQQNSPIPPQTLGVSFPSTTFSYIKFSSRSRPRTWWALNQCKTTISAHLLGSSMILKVFHYFSRMLSSVQQSLPYGCIFFRLEMSLCHILLCSGWNSSVFIPQALALIYFITTSSYPFPFPNLILFFTLRVSANITSGEANENSSFCPRLQASSTKIKT